MSNFRAALRVCVVSLVFTPDAHLQAQSKTAADPEIDLQRYLAGIRAEREKSMQASRERQSNLDKLYSSAENSLSSKDYSAAEAAFRNLYIQEKPNDRGLRGLIRVYLAQNRAEEAIALVQRQFAIQPFNAELLLWFADTAEEAGSPEVAVTALTNQTLRVTPDVKFALLTRLSALQSKMARFPEAITSLRQALDLRPDDRSTSLALANAFRANGQDADAQRVYQDLLGALPTDPLELINCALDVGCNGGSGTIARVCAEFAHALQPEDSVVTEGFALVEARYNYADVPIFEDLTSKHPDSAAYRQDLAIALFANGKIDRALAEFREALKFAHSDDERSDIQARIDAIGSFPRSK